MRAFLIAVLTMAMLPGLALAREDDARYEQPAVVYGAGNMSCGRWVERHEPMAMHWVLGYLSGVSRESRSLSETDSDAVKAWLDNYCQEHPIKPLSAAARALVDELMP